MDKTRWVAGPKGIYLFTFRVKPAQHSGSEGKDSLSRENDQKLAALYCKTNRKLPFLKAAKGCFENSMK